MYIKGEIPMTFEWDERKNRINKQKHGISFEESVRVFNDEDSIEIYDREHSATEDRYVVIGKIADGMIICLVFTCRKRDVLRFISSRPANAKEKEEYYGTYQINHLR